MIEVLAYSADPSQLGGLLHPSGPLGNTYFVIIARFMLLYGIPAIVMAAVTALTLCLFSRRPRFAISEALVFLVPISLWLTLVYADPSYKGMSNVWELAALGMLVGLVLGINGRLVRPFVNGVTSVWFLCVVATLMYVYVPGYPTRFPLP